MIFEIGEVLSRALTITWRHKPFWGFIIIPMLIGFLTIPLFFIPLFFLEENSLGSPSFIENPIFGVIFIILHLILGLVILMVTTLGYSSLTLGIVRVERSEEGLKFRGLLQDGMKYFPRMFGVILLTYVGSSVGFFAIFAGLALFGVVTAGIGFICAQPLIILLYPIIMVVYAFMEQSQAAVVVDEMGVMQAIAKGWELLKTNFWRLVLISFIIYMGVGIVSSIVIMPFMIPFFFLPFLFESSNFDSQTLGLSMTVFMILLMPVMALVQGVTITFMKATYIIVYLRLTRPSNTALTLEAAA